MAAAGSNRMSIGVAIEQIISEHCECGICLSQNDLRLLPCQHRICLPCLERIEAEAKQRKSKPRCAYCRKKLQLPANRYPVCRLSKAMKEQCSSLVIQRKESRPQKIATKTDPIGECESVSCRRDVDVRCRMCHTYLCYRCSQDSCCPRLDGPCETEDFRLAYQTAKNKLEQHSLALEHKKSRLEGLINKDVRLMKSLPDDNSEEADDMFTDLEQSIAARRGQIKVIESQICLDHSILQLRSVKTQVELVMKVSRINLSTEQTTTSITRKPKKVCKDDDGECDSDYEDIDDSYENEEDVEKLHRDTVKPPALHRKPQNPIKTPKTGNPGRSQPVISPGTGPCPSYVEIISEANDADSYGSSENDKDCTHKTEHNNKQSKGYDTGHRTPHHTRQGYQDMGQQVLKLSSGQTIPVTVETAELKLTNENQEKDNNSEVSESSDCSESDNDAGEYLKPIPQENPTLPQETPPLPPRATVYKNRPISVSDNMSDGEEEGTLDDDPPLIPPRGYQIPPALIPRAKAANETTINSLQEPKDNEEPPLLLTRGRPPPTTNHDLHYEGPDLASVTLRHPPQMCPKKSKKPSGREIKEPVVLDRTNQPIRSTSSSISEEDKQQSLKRLDSDESSTDNVFIDQPPNIPVVKRGRKPSDRQNVESVIILPGKRSFSLKKNTPSTSQQSSVISSTAQHTPAVTSTSPAKVDSDVVTQESNSNIKAIGSSLKIGIDDEEAKLAKEGNVVSKSGIDTNNNNGSRVNRNNNKEVEVNPSETSTTESGDNLEYEGIKLINHPATLRLVRLMNLEPDDLETNPELMSGIISLIQTHGGLEAVQSELDDLEATREDNSS